jgi:hypothetical protein
MKMKQKSQTRQTGAAKAIKDIRRTTDSWANNDGCSHHFAG